MWEPETSVGWLKQEECALSSKFLFKSGSRVLSYLKVSNYLFCYARETDIEIDKTAGNKSMTFPSCSVKNSVTLAIRKECCLYQQSNF